MPFYEYECVDCHKTFTVMTSVKNYSEFVHCEYCKGVGKRVFSAPHKMLLDRATMRKHSYPQEHGLR